jgi:hypothetical protein
VTQASNALQPERDRGDRGLAQERDEGSALSLAWVAAISVFFLLGWPAAFADGAELAGYLYDDAYYYLTIARNVAAGMGPTFDGLSRTNGFHPLWLLVLTGMFSLDPNALDAVRIVIALQAGLAASGCFLVMSALSRRISSVGVLLFSVLLLGLPRSSFALSGGMESALLFLFLIVAWRVQKWTFAALGVSRLIVLGTVWAAVFATRLEALVGILVPACALLLSKNATGTRAPATSRARYLAALGIIPLLTVATYVTLNLRMFGTWFPVSAAVKAMIRDHAAGWGWPTTWVHWFPWPGYDVVTSLGVHPEALSSVQALVYGFAIAATIAGLTFYRRSIWGALRRAECTSLVLICLLIIAVDLVGMGRFYYSQMWYLLPLRLLQALVLASVLERLPKLGWAVLALGVVWIGVRWDRLPAHTDHTTQAHAAGAWLRAHSEPDARIGSWNAGAIGYFSERSVVNLDGLVNTPNYLESVLVPGARSEFAPFSAYVSSREIQWVADQRCAPTGGPCGSPLFGEFPCPLTEQRVFVKTGAKHEVAIWAADCRLPE